ncbi:Bifunctional transcriptional activator/DNA repair enzyme Ada [Vibrio aerogenes CECT 7868]|uniref:methylated-DNA--[protein]-cysteine S-methyltransferase n=1 Tax=Vibrio aerogenes CECT 7868 TaxID=1216006 RepID=A0A1M5V331_9VIBR|nr:methylated-DNA--[protein]-cysteine S-methyltransferase [Vibrio aerogenes]SHH69682.1 Bifunctional transcriptional activator/DNA repair enzyme Ada [Vibrio aerogenes CECT 7868]
MAEIQARLLQIAHTIEANADETLSLEQLAKQAAVSPYYLQRKFREMFGISPREYQNAIRIQRMKQLLRQGDTVSGAIYAVGFGSGSRVYEQVNQKIGMTPSDYRSGGQDMHIAFAVRETVFGLLIMAATERGVCFVHFGESIASLIQALHTEFPNALLDPTPDAVSAELDLWIEALELYLASRGPRPDLPLHLRGTAFQVSVWKFLMSIKEGQTMSYKQVAEGIGSPKSYRAVANACGANHIAVLIPCHRVLRGDGQRGGYRWGEERKVRLLEKENPRKIT